MGVDGITHTWLGIDFSGNHLMWRLNRKSNVYIAEVRLRQGRPLLSTLQTVQELPGREEPFQRLVSLLRAKDYNAAAIDAPFSVPCECLPSEGHLALLEQVARIERKNRPFPTAQDFVCRILSGRAMLRKKPLRESERSWSKNEDKCSIHSLGWLKRRSRDDCGLPNPASPEPVPNLAVTSSQ
jgi:hypothetical protein